MSQNLCVGEFCPKTAFHGVFVILFIVHAHNTTFGFEIDLIIGFTISKYLIMVIFFKRKCYFNPFLQILCLEMVIMGGIGILP